MKHRLICILILVLTMALSGCGAATNGDAELGESGITIVCAGFAEYDWTMNIMGELAEGTDITYLAQNGADMHSYQPGTADIAKISSCNLLIYAGGNSQQWIDDLVANRVDEPGFIPIDMVDTLGNAVLEEECVEGMECEEEEPAEAIEYDEHVWLSARNAEIICSHIAGALCNLDPNHEEIYMNNYEEYYAKLVTLDKNYAETIGNAARDTIIVADRFPFRYIADDYQLNYYAAFPGCSAESEASFETIIFLANKCDELSLPVIFKIDGSDSSIPETVTYNTVSSPKILELDSLQAVSGEDISDGLTYISAMENNLSKLSQALN